MANGNDPANIPYIIVENGFYYVAYKEKVKVPEVVVSSKGVANGLSEEYNDGWDFGPDSYSPTSTSAIPYTETAGVQEFFDYLINNQSVNTVGRILNGVYDFTNAPFQSYTNNAGESEAKIIVGSGVPLGKLGQNITIYAGNSALWGSEVVGSPSPTTGVIFRDTTSASGTGQQFILGIKGSDSSLAYASAIVINIVGGISGLVAQTDGIGGFDFKPCSVLDADWIQVATVGEWAAPEPSNTYQVGINLCGEYNAYSRIGSLLLANGLYNGVNIGHHPVIDNLMVWGVLNAIYIDNGIHEGIIVHIDIEYSTNIISFASTYSSGVNSPLKIVYMSIANNNSYSNGATWMNPSSFMVIPSGVSVSWTVYIDLLSYFGGLVPSNYYPATTNLYIRNIQYSNTTINSYFTGNPSISANPPVSGTVYQNTNPYAIEIDLPVYASTAGTAGYVTIAKGSTDSPTSIGNQYVSGDTSDTSEQIIKLRVPAGWYYEFTASGVTFGTASVFAD